MKQARILLLDFVPAEGLGSLLQTILESASCLDVHLRQERIESCRYAYKTDLMEIIPTFDPALIFVIPSPDLMEQDGEIFRFIRGLSEAPIISVIENDDSDVIFEFLRLGSVDFITPPLRAIEIVPRIWRLIKQAGHKKETLKTLKEMLGLKRLVGESPAFLAEIRKVPLIAKCDASILISGETGTGKELFARAIHYLSPRASKPFIAVNCGAIPTDLMENELFGHMRGAFTGANTSHLGLVHEADGGALFLDEVDCLPPLAQVKLLRFLQEKEYRPLGSTKTSKADVRVIAASNVDFEEAVRAGKIRQDLYYRLNVVPLNLPPLRKRQEDIPLLAHHFLDKYAAEFNREAIKFSPEAMQMLMIYNWPGNVRELEHIIQRAVVLCEGEIIRSDHIILPRREAVVSTKAFKEMKADIIAQFEKSYIQGLLQAHCGNITKAAQAARKNRRAFWQLIQKYRINVQNFRLDERNSGAFMSMGSLESVEPNQAA